MILEVVWKVSTVPDDATFASQIALVQQLSFSKVPIDLSDASSIWSSPNMITNWQPSIQCSPMLTIDQAQSKEHGHKMKKRATNPNNTDHRCTSINQEGAKMNYNYITITEIHRTDAFYIKK